MRTHQSIAPSIGAQNCDQWRKSSDEESSFELTVCMPIKPAKSLHRGLNVVLEA